MARKILFVEDDPSQQDLLKDAVADWNAKNPTRQFHGEFAASLDEGKAALDTTRFDGALCDLRLPEHEDGKAKNPLGTQIAELGLSDYGIPVGILSGFPADFNRDSVAHGLLEVFDKGDNGSHDKAIAWFGQLWPMLAILDGARDNIRRAGAEVFVRRIWPRWSAYEALPNVPPDEITNIVTRQYASHIAELLGLDSEDNTKWHPFENYISPSLQESRPYTGDIFDIEGTKWIILSPQCDMVNESTQTVIMAQCDETQLKDWDDTVKQFHENGITEKKAKQRDRFFSDLVNQNGRPSQHFLPPLNGGRPILVDFRTLKVAELDYLKQNLNSRIASVAPPFLPNLTQRFGAHVSRSGQPNIDVRYFA